MTSSSTAFLAEFFAAPNASWPDCDPTHPAAGYLRPFIRALDIRGDCPLILPRREPTWVAPITYVICWDVSHSSRVRPLLEAAAAHAWVPFDGRVARLNQSDAVEASISSRVGAHCTYRLNPSATTHGALWKSLSRLVATLEARPPRTFVLPRPAGRMLREFEAALASGQAETSAALLREIDLVGGVSLENLAFLSVRRFSRLGKDAGLLAMPTLDAIATAEPPKLIRDAILTAWARQVLSQENLIETDDISRNIELLRTHRPPIAVLVRDDSDQSWSADALPVVALIAIARNSASLAANVLDQGEMLPEILRARLLGIATAAHAPIEPPRSDEALPRVEPESAPEEPAGQPASWLEWVRHALDNESIHPPDPDLAEAWEPIGLADQTVADTIDGAPDTAGDAILAMAGTFIDADQYMHPAWRSAGALIRRYLIAEQLSPSDLAVICALLSIALRGSPPASDYRGLLQDLQDYAPTWVSPSQPLPSLDLADAVASAARPDLSAAVALVTTLVGPLHAQRRRLSPTMAGLANLVTDDLALGWDWTPPPAEQGGIAEPPEHRRRGPFGFLLYSLDEAVLRRVTATLAVIYPEARVSVSSEKVGSPRLRELARGADYVVLATQCAAHSATGFIVRHMRPDAKIVYPDGAGSASMLRSIELALELN